jgi:hypothetical protein
LRIIMLPHPFLGIDSSILFQNRPVRVSAMNPYLP